MGAAMAQLAALLYYKRNWQVFHGQNRIKVFAFSSPAIFNSSARGIYDQSVGGLNSILFYVNGDTVNLVPLYHAGIPVRLDFSSRPTAVRAGVHLLWSLKGAILGAALEATDRLEALKNAGKIALAVHTIDGFTQTDIKKAMEKIQGNFLKNPDMGFGLLGK